MTRFDNLTLRVVEKENEKLRDLALTLPQKIRCAEENGMDGFSVIIHGYQIQYYHNGIEWRGYVLDTAD